MDCPSTHEWYELERGGVPRDQAERLRRHLAECPACRSHAEGVRDVAASLERLAGLTRADLSAEAAESLLRRAKVRGLLGRPPRTPLSVRAGRARWIQWAIPVAVTAAAALIVAVGLQMSAPRKVLPHGALEVLVRSAHGIKKVEHLRPLVAAARAAVSEELARAEPDPDQVGDLLLVAYICGRPRENRQVGDVDFLLGGIWARRSRRVTPIVYEKSAWPVLIPSAMAETPDAPRAAGAAAGLTLSGDHENRASPLAAAREHLLEGDYRAALAVLPRDDSGVVLRAWCLEALGRRTEAAQALAEAEDLSDGPLARIVRADLALGDQNVAEAMRQYESLAADRDRYWFSAGYLCRYELADARGAGVRFERVRDEELAGYVARNFQAELAAVRVPAPSPLFAEDFEESDLGHPADWTLVRIRGGEFEIIEVPGGKALRQDEVRFHGAEFLCGEVGWTDYTLRVDVKVVASQGDYTLGAAAYRQAGHTGYVLELSPTRVRIVKQFASSGEVRKSLGGSVERLGIEPQQAQMRLDQPPAQGWWYTMKLRVQRVDDGVSVAGKVWRSDLDEPLGWQVVWTDVGQGGVPPLSGGVAGVQLSGARALIDNIVITRNEPSKELVATAP